MSRPKPPPSPSTPDEIEQQLYEALQRADIDALMAVWSDDDDIVCVHPGGPRVVGAAAIRASFEAIFASGAIDVRPEKVRRQQTLNCAVHSVLERVNVPTEQGPKSAWVVATNVYVKSGGAWALAAHHASPGSPHEAQDVVEPASTLH
jgi:uncharacterized protein (TIGR02246 family)